MLAGYIQHDHGTPKAILVTLQARKSLLDMVGTARSSHPSKEDILKCSKDSLLR